MGQGHRGEEVRKYWEVRGLWWTRRLETDLRNLEVFYAADAASPFLLPTLPLPTSLPPFICFLIYIPDCHMAAIPALDSACHHALTLIGLICYSFPSGLGRILGTWSHDVSRQHFQLTLSHLSGCQDLAQR